ncbi:MAG: hypothetical protein AAF821_02365 [Cyanobacteria bacterium P01_D01_bin.156]
MTSQKDQIQRLIAEIEAALAKPPSRLSLGFAEEVDRQRQLLGELSDYLQSLEQMFESPGGWGPLDPDTGQLVSPQVSTAQTEDAASQVLQGLVLEMRYLRENSLRPMRQELEALRQKRESLQAEINVLEARRTEPVLSEEQLNAFLETLMQRLQEQLSAQMVQNFAAMETATVEQLSAAETSPVPMLSGQRLDQVRLLQAQSDQLLVKLDTTLTAVFDSLQKSVDSYRDSLEEGLSQMHGLGRQGEVIFHAFINHLAQQLGQDASSYLASSLNGPAPLEEPRVTEVVEPVQLNELEQALENLALEEEIGDVTASSELTLDLDLQLSEADEEVTLLQSNPLDVNDLALLEEDIDLKGGNIDLDGDITVIQFGAPDVERDDVAAIQEDADVDSVSDPLEEAFLASDDNLDAVPLDLSDSLEGVEESLELLAVSADADATMESSALSPEASDGELFNFDLDFDAPGSVSHEAEQQFTKSVPSAPDSELRPLSEDLLAFSFADDAPETLTEAELLEAEQVAEALLFNQSSVVSSDVGKNNIEEDASEHLSSHTPEEVIAEESEPTVETLFGDSVPEVVETSPQVEAPESIVSLSDLLPESQTADAVLDIPENLPDDVYIPASADEDLINLVESDSEQHLLLELDDDPLVEQLGEDLQKLANVDFSTDYAVQDENALESIEQDTLETVVQDLDFGDLEMDEGPEESSSEDSLSSDLDGDASIDDDASIKDADELLVTDPTEGSSVSDADDLFREFSVDSVDMDPPLDGQDSVIAAFTAPLSDELDWSDIGDPLDEDDGIPDSLANELADLSQRSNALSQQANDDDEQLFSDLEAPLLDNLIEAPPAVIDAEPPALNSASMPDMSFELEGDDLELDLSADSEEFLQAEQQAFWQTQTATDEDASLSKASDGGIASGADGDIASDFDDLLTVEESTTPSELSFNEESQELDDLDDFFNGSSLAESSLPDLETSQDESIQDEDAVVFLEDNPLILSEDESLTQLDLDTASLVEESAEAVNAFVPLDIPEEVVATDALLDLAGIATEVDVEEPTPLVTLAASGPPLETPLPAVDSEGAWFLGLDVGTTGISVVFMNRRTGQVYPLYWQTDASDEAKHFRLPALAVMTAAQETVAVGYDALGDFEDLLLNVAGSEVPELVGVNRLKPLFKVAVGHGQTLPMSDPWIRWSDRVELPMLQVLQAMVQLLRYVMNHGQAVGLDEQTLNQVWRELQGVIVGYPTNWPDTYSFNLREAVLAAGIIEHPEQVIFVEDAIATVLSGLPDPHEISVAETVPLSRQPSLYNCQWQEGTIVVSAGATMTELALVDLPQTLNNLDYSDFALRSFAYAGDALDQDIVCQLLIPDERRQSIENTDPSNTWDWQGHLLAQDADWSLLNLSDLALPAVGHVDWAQRYRLQQRLLSSNLGQSLLAAARHLKWALQQKNQVRLSLGGQCWVIKRRHLENLIFLPYIQRINGALDKLLSKQTVDAQSIKQVVCTGGSASLPAIARWLRQKFPNATIIQDTYAADLPQSCSRVAYGLVNVARYPQVFNITRQQYSDYFLLMELLRVFPQQPLPVGAIMHLLEQRGINTQACHLHILALLEGHLPPGLVPTSADRGLICDRTTDLPTYRALLQTPLFNKSVTESGGQIYIPNEPQAEQLRAYCNRLLLHKAQTLEEPLIAHIETPVYG